MNTTLILEGGGMRGVFTAGVLDAFLAMGLRLRRVYGVSAGACHACSYLSGQRGRAFRTVTEYLGDPRYMGVRTFLRTGDFFGVQMVYDEIPNKLIPYDYRAYAASGAEFYAAVTNCDTGCAEYMRVHDMLDDLVVIQASSSLPLLSRMVKIGDGKYLDGGISDSIPLVQSLIDGNTRHVVVLTQHRGFRKQPASLRLMRLRYRKYPALVASYARRHERYNAALELVYAEEAAGRAIVIQPREPVDIGRLEKDRGRLERLYQKGFNEAKDQAETLQAFCEEAD